MIYSNIRKQVLSGWLKNNDINSYQNPLKLQKFLLLYELMAKTDNEESDFTYLKGYIKGPVFSNVWGDYTKNREEFNLSVSIAYDKQKHMVNSYRAKLCDFIVKTSTEKQLSDLTHKLNLWKTKSLRIANNEKQVELEEKDFNEEDKDLINTLKSMYSKDLVNNSFIININDKFFVFNNIYKSMITQERYDALVKISTSEELYNPIFVEIDDAGRLIID